MDKEFNQKLAKFIINDLKGISRKFKKEIDFIEPKYISNMIFREVSGLSSRKETRDLCNIQYSR